MPNFQFFLLYHTNAEHYSIWFAFPVSAVEKLLLIFLFSPASDGQHIYIHSFNVKMLKHDYGSLKDAPTTITAKILSKESDYMSEGYRKCFKYLAHLPVTCPFETMEIEMGDTVVSQETLDFFSGR